MHWLINSIRYNYMGLCLKNNFTTLPLKNKRFPVSGQINQFTQYTFYKTYYFSLHCQRKKCVQIIQN